MSALNMLESIGSLIRSQRAHDVEKIALEGLDMVNPEIGTIASEVLNVIDPTLQVTATVTGTVPAITPEAASHVVDNASLAAANIANNPKGTAEEMRLQAIESALPDILAKHKDVEDSVLKIIEVLAPLIRKLGL